MPQSSPQRQLPVVGVLGGVLVLVVAVLLGGRATGVIGGGASDDLVTTARPGTALAALGTLAVKGRAPKTGYSRERFGQAWTDVDGNGCDTRDDVLARDLTDLRRRRGETCQVASGVLHDPYTPKTIRFVRGPGSAAVQIDHVVALSDAWQTGAARWGTATRTALANDPLNLLAVDGPLNEAKGDADAATWLPPNKAYRCAYVARQVAVKAKYGAWVTPAERTAIARVLGTCPAQRLPVDPGAVRVPGTPAAPRASGSPSSAVGPSPAAPATPFSSCAAARAAGAAPLHRGDPGYSAALDRDGDGSACE